MTSSLWPEWEKIITLSILFISPISPCSASPAFIKLECDPVLESVAETFLAICPDFPIPKVIILPLVLSNLSHTSLNSDDKVSDRF